MRPKILATTGAALLFSGCTPVMLDSPESAPLGAILGTTASTGAAAAAPADDQPTDVASEASGQEKFDALRVTGHVDAPGEYKMYDLGAADAGDEWIISDTGDTAGVFVVVLLDNEFNLIDRAYMGAQAAMRQIVRRATAHTFIGVMTPNGGGGGDFDFDAVRRSRQVVPTPQAQTVWLNFGAGQDVRVHRDEPISFPAFDGTMIDQRYADHTQEIKDSIVALMRADYASYAVTIISSDESGPPDGSFSVVHFGGEVPGLLGLADSVDAYNRAASQVAVIYVGSFAPYRTMELTPAQMGVMIGNVASHELGHLLGLYHTRNPSDIMDTTGTAWELAGEQAFSRAALEESVFATGMEDSPRLLEQGVGLNPVPATAKSAAAQRIRTVPLLNSIRRFSAGEIPHACGTCLRLDE